MHILLLLVVFGESNKKIFCVLNLLNFIKLRYGKVQDNKLKSFKNKHFAENGKEKVIPNDYSFLSNLKNVKTNILF